MKHLTAQYIITNYGPPLKRAVINTDDDGTIISIEDTKGELKERHSTEFYNGIIIPGFVNCHCHLELSHMKGLAQEGEGLGKFIEQVRSTREFNTENIYSATLSADHNMYSDGVNLCADVCNKADSFQIKKESRIKYNNLIEVFGIDPEKALRRLEEATEVAELAGKMDLVYSLVPHSAYSMSLTLLRMLKKICRGNRLTSVHFMEAAAEELFLGKHEGPLMESYKKSGIFPQRPETVKSHADLVLNEITKSGNLILVHNTFTRKEIISEVRKRRNLFWCLCPNSNIFIENKLPPLDLLLEENCEIVIGTDSLASNSGLSMLEELKTLQFNFPGIRLEDLIKWSTLNGAVALGEEKEFGSIEPGKKPGLLLLRDVDLQNMKLLPESFVTRLV